MAEKVEEMTPSKISVKQFVSPFPGIPFSKLLSSVSYGAKANIYRPTTIADMELSTPQCLLLALLNSLVTGDVMACLLLADICYRIERLRSRHYKVWLLEDFVFPRPDMQKAMTLFTELKADGTLKLPPHVLGIMISLANKYGVNAVQLRTISEEWCDDVANQLENAVANNSPGDIIAIATEGGNINGLTPSGESLIHFAARAGNCASIAALGFLKADLEVENSSNATPLEEAVKHDRGPSVKTLLTAGAKVNKRFYRGDTYLHMAAARGSNGTLEILLERGLEINEKNYFGETPLFQAVRAGNVQGMELLLERGAENSIVPEGGMSLTEMVLESQNLDMLRAFIKSGADLKTNQGDTILHLIAQSGNVEMLKVIKNTKLQENLKNQNGLTPLHVTSDPSVVKVLIRMGIDVNIKTGTGETALHLASAKGSLELVKALVLHGASVDSQDEGGASALMITSKNSKLDIVNFLLHKGANPNIKDKEGRTPLHYAAEGGCVGSVATLLDAGVKVDCLNNKDETPALVAALNNKPAVLKLLLESGADLTQWDCNGNGIIHRVAQRGHTEVMTVLLDAGVMVDMKCRDQWTALHFAARSGHTEIVKALLDAGIAVNIKGKDYTPLHHAALGGHTAVVTVLLDHGADLAAKLDRGWTPLMLASRDGHLAAVQLLVDRGATLNERDNDGRTALWWAKNNIHEAVANYLRSKGGV